MPGVNVEANLHAVKNTLPEGVTLVAVSKFHSVNERLHTPQGSACLVKAMNRS